MRFTYKLLPLIFTLLLVNLHAASGNVQTGLDRVQEFQDWFSGKRIGIVTNHTAYTSDGRYIVNVFLNLPGVQVTALFGPEHGIRGQMDAGQKITGEDRLAGIPIYSLYGETVKPTKEMLNNVDVLVFDIQDIGARFYTYIWTMALSMEAAAEQGKTFIVLDRPNPINGIDVQGPVLDKAFASFVGLYPIPVRHGMTVGELATMFNEEGWLKNGVKARLKIVPMQGWQRAMWYDQTGLKFIKPSPNMPDLQTAAVYPGLCLLEGTNVSEGRGTHQPFLQFGAPWIDQKQFTDMLNGLSLPGVSFEPTVFTPVAIPGMSMHPKLKNRTCYGCRIQINDRDLLQPFDVGLAIVDAIYFLYPDNFTWRSEHFDRLCGTDRIRRAIETQTPVREIARQWQAKLKEFKAIREKYLLYR